MLNKERDYT